MFDQLSEANNKITVMNKKVQQLDQQNESLKKECVEMHEKYSDKSKEKAKLQELYNSLKRKYDQAFRDNIHTNSNSPDLTVSNQWYCYNTKSKFVFLKTDAKTSISSNVWKGWYQACARK